jgi:hypothetical protein
VVGNVVSDIVVEYEYEKWGGTCHVKVYPLEVTELLESWPEKGQRERRVVNISEALDMVKSKHREAIVEFNELCSRGGPGIAGRAG